MEFFILDCWQPCTDTSPFEWLPSHDPLQSDIFPGGAGEFIGLVKGGPVPCKFLHGTFLTKNKLVLVRGLVLCSTQVSTIVSDH